MSEPRRWTLHADNTWEPANDSAHESYVEEGTQAIEAAPVEAELARCREGYRLQYEALGRYQAQVRELEAELERLRVALRRVIRVLGHPALHVQASEDEAQRIALEALGDEVDHGE